MLCFVIILLMLRFVSFPHVSAVKHYIFAASIILFNWK